MKRLIKWLNDLERLVSIIILLFVLIIMAWQVIARVLLHIPNAWSEELTRYLCFGLVFFSSSYAVRDEAHIRIDGLLGLYPKKIRMFVVLLGYAALFTYCIFVGAHGCNYTYVAWRMGQVAPSLGGTPMWVFYITLPIAHFCMAVRSAEVFVRIIRRGSWQVPLDQEKEVPQ